MLSLTQTKVNPYSKADMKKFREICDNMDEFHEEVEKFINFVIGDPKKE